MEAGTGKVDDLAALAKLTEQTLLKELELRYGQGQIYTYIGDILVAVNPFQQLPLYDSKHSKEYRNIKVKSKLKPHIFAVADCIYQDLLTNKEPQCCVVSGESGAGKTETTKLLVRQIVQLCTKSGSVAASSKLHDALIEINPLMEAFGNAQTKMNGNSSRFGKYIELLFSDRGELFGGRVSIFLLEKTRVTGFNRDEQNFHIFYHMFAGLSERQRTSVLLTNPDRHRILKSGDSCSIFTSKAHQLHHKAMFIKLQKILTNTGFLQEDCEMIYAYLSAILHLTDIQFEPDQETDGVL
ncbi:Myo21 [Bugula neritina]|uniref:Myo21 n=1 Tax=Bugula neritina TaxID=10212 RepID=A0A7J7JQ06_BUGNE|nr:Myo21 [Bugula neritina]